MIEYINKEGLTEFYTKIKDKIPTKTSDLTNDSNYMTAEQVTAAITTALSAYGDGNTTAF